MAASIRRGLIVFVTQFPTLATIAKAARKHLRDKFVPFQSTADYWDTRYRSGGTSGAGSYGRLAQFKASVVNQFVQEHDVQSVLELGCGDGGQLELARYPEYVGVDISPSIIEVCKSKFRADRSKQFYVASDKEAESVTADLVLSLDVIYHLVEDELYQQYMQRLVSAARRYVCIYSSNAEKMGHMPHIRHHCVTDWFAIHAPEWELLSRIANPFPSELANPDQTSWADFYIYTRNS
jgi:SAM-dependent methyltransferase